MRSDTVGSPGFSGWWSFSNVSRAGWLWLFLAIDLGLIGMHFLRWGEAWLLTTDGGWGERWGYMKEAATAVALLIAYRRSKQAIYAAWAAVFVYVLCDDALMIHELGGKALADLFAFTSLFGLRPRDEGELLVSAAAGLLLLGAGWFAFRRSDTAARLHSKVLLWLFAVLVFFGVVVDMAHIILASAGFSLRMNVLEDGGELMALSLLAAYALHLLGKQIPPPSRQRR